MFIALYPPLCALDYVEQDSLLRKKTDFFFTGSYGVPDVQSEAHLHLLDRHRRLHLIRACEELIVQRYAEDEMKTPMHMSWGQEAAALGVSDAVGVEADFFGTYRSHALYLSRTGDVEGFFGELLGRTGGLSSGVGGSMHLSSPKSGVFNSTAIVGGNIAPAVGAAFANRVRATGRLAVSVFGDGALDTGTFWESINLALLYRAPVLFVCEDNELAVHSGPESRRSWGPSGSLRQALEGLGMPYVREESLNVHRLAERLRGVADGVREAEGHAFVHLSWFRHLEHVGISSDAEAEYRKNDSSTAQRNVDPILISKLYLESLNIPLSEIESVEEANLGEVSVAFETARKSGFLEFAAAKERVFS